MCFLIVFVGLFVYIIYVLVFLNSIVCVFIIVFVLIVMLGLIKYLVYNYVLVLMVIGRV